MRVPLLNIWIYIVSFDLEAEKLSGSLSFVSNSQSAMSDFCSRALIQCFVSPGPGMSCMHVVEDSQPIP